MKTRTEKEMFDLINEFAKADNWRSCKVKMKKQLTETQNISGLLWISSLS